MIEALGAPTPDRMTSASLTHLVVHDPTTGQPLRFSRLWHDSVYRGTRTWAGVLVPNGVDEVVLTFADDRVHGSLAVAGREWSISGTTDALVVAESFMDADEACGDSASDLAPFEDSASPPSMMSMSMPSEHGPYEADGMPYVDLLFVYPQSTVDLYANEADLQLGIVNAVATLQTALIASEVYGRVRLVGMEKIGWTPASSNGAGLLLYGETLAELADGTNGAEEAHLLREWYGADLVMGVVPPLLGASGAARSPREEPGPATDHRAFAIVATGSLNTSTRHEIGHLGSLGHWRDDIAPCVPDTDPNCPQTTNCRSGNYHLTGYGYIWPNAADTTDPSAPQCIERGMRTIMGNGGGFQTINGTQITRYDRINRFSNPNLQYTWTCTDATWQQPATYATGPIGSTSTNSEGCSAEGASRLTETWPAIAAYRPEQPSAGGAVLALPLAGSTISGSVNFLWSNVPASNTFWLSVWIPDTGAVLHDAAVSSTNSIISVNVAGIPSTTSPIAARLWTWWPAPLEAWSFRETRYNTALKWTSCGVDEPDMPPDPAYAPLGCTDASGPVCTWDGGASRASCTLARPHGNFLSATAYAVSGYRQGDTYDIAAWGSTSAGNSFCCLFHDPGKQVTEVEITGGAANDTLRLRTETTGQMLQRYGQSSLNGVLRGNNGADSLYGSNAVDVGYTDFLFGGSGPDALFGGNGDDWLYGGSGQDILRGNDGDDRLYGEANNDILEGGSGQDFLHGGAGTDTLNGGPGADVLVSTSNTYDQLFGGDGSDALCATFLGVRMVGSPTTSSGLNSLYWSSTATGSPADLAAGILNSQGNGVIHQCGHTNHAPYLGWCSNVLMTASPAACLSAGVGN